MADGKSGSGGSDPHIAFMVIHQATYLIVGECAVDMIVYDIILGRSDEGIRMEDINTVIGAYPHPPVLVFFDDTDTFLSIVVLQEVPELIAVLRLYG